MKENQYSIYNWSREAFGIPTTHRCIARANEEMAELVKTDAIRGSFDEIMKEAADIVIVLKILAAICSRDLDQAVDDKMGINRKREWVGDGNGCGYHK